VRKFTHLGLSSLVFFLQLFQFGSLLSDALSEIAEGNCHIGHDAELLQGETEKSELDLLNLRSQQAGVKGRGIDKDETAGVFVAARQFMRGHNRDQVPYLPPRR
jgi:hypothetical protein